MYVLMISRAWLYITFSGFNGSDNMICLVFVDLYTVLNNWSAILENVNKCSQKSA